jgi:general stress protein 26
MPGSIVDALKSNSRSIDIKRYPWYLVFELISKLKIDSYLKTLDTQLIFNIMINNMSPISMLFSWAIVFFFPINGNSQVLVLKDSLDVKYVEAAGEIMSDAATCALITLDAKGRPRVRAMDPFLPEQDLTVWLATNPKSRKVAQIENDPRVTLYYLDGDLSGYVMIHGSAELIDDETEKARHWKDEWETFYPNYPDDYLLIKVLPEWMEIVSYSRGMVGESVTWRPPIVKIRPDK